MAYTADCDTCVAVHENGINDLIARLMLEVPSFFNFGSSFIASYPQLACNPIQAAPIDPEDPLISPIDVSGIPPLLFNTSLNPFPTETPPIGTPVISQANARVTITPGPPTINLEIPIPCVGVSINSSEVAVEADVGP